MKHLLLLGIIAFILVSCRGGVGDPEQFDYRVGSDALKMEFEENLPPESVYEGTTTPLSIHLSNEGAEAIRNGVLVIISDERLLSLPQGISIDGVTVSAEALNKASFDLDGRSISNPIGGKAFLSGTLQVKDIGAQREELATRLTVQSCYTYRTFARRSVCLDTDVYKQVQLAKACEMEDVSAGTQGAPVAVSDIEVQVTPHPTNPRKVVPRFVFKVQNVGDGEVLSAGLYKEACSSSGSADFNEVRLIARMPSERGSERLTCSPSLSDQATDIGLVKLKAKQNAVRCSLDEGIDAERGAYTVLLEVELDYGYTQTITRELTIKKGAG